MWEIFDRCRIFFINFFIALKFICFDYDARLRMKYSPSQRILIWGGIFIGVFTFCFLLLLLIRYVVLGFF